MVLVWNQIPSSKSVTWGSGFLSGSFFLIGPLDLVGMQFGEDQRTNMVKTRV